ncbi:glycosyltransferase [Candidatus Parvarchaeota archaeon]|nr:glycosyltransferase [Candidatus Parvarchaeota archaeon]
MVVYSHFLYLAYIYISIIISVSSSLYILLIFYFYKKKEKTESNNNTKDSLTIIIPVYNEDKELFEKCIEAVKKQKTKFIVIGNGCYSPYKEITERNEGKFVYLQKNVGKKGALAAGIKLIKSEYVMFLDSDTILPNKAVEKILGKFDDKTAGVGAEVRIIKEKDKFVYYPSEMLQRLRQLSFKAMSYFNRVMVINGQCAVYRTDIIRDFVSSDDFLNSKFFGKKMIIGDDITITKYVNGLGYKTKMAQDVVVLTKGQSSFKNLVKQSIRWSRSGYINFINSFKDRSIFRNGPLYTFSMFYIYTLPFLVLAELILRGGLLARIIFRRGIMEGGIILIRSLFVVPRVLQSFSAVYTGLKIISILSAAIMIYLIVKNMKKDKIRILSYGSIMLLVMFLTAIYAMLSLNKHDRWLTR